MIERMKKSISLAIAMLIVMATIAVPVAMAETNTTRGAEASGAGCGTCGAQNTNGSCGCCGDKGIISITGQQLNGSEKNKAVAIALAYPKVKDIRQILLDKGFRPSVNDSMAMEITKVNETGTYNITLVIIPYDRTDGVHASIIFGTGDDGTDAFYINGLNWDCWTKCAGTSCVTCAGACVWGCRYAGPLALECSLGCLVVCGVLCSTTCIYACWE